MTESTYGGLTHSCIDADCHVPGFILTLTAGHPSSEEGAEGLRLTEAEREAMLFALAAPDPDRGPTTEIQRMYVVAAVERILADRLAAVQAEREGWVQVAADRTRERDAEARACEVVRTRAESAEAALDAARREADEANVHAIECERIGVKAIEDRIMAEAERDDLRARLGAVETLVPDECLITRNEWRCTAMIGAGFPNRAKFTEDMCCTYCRLRAALANPSAVQGGRDV